MDTRKIENYVRLFGMDVLMVLGGLILLFNPDGATALVTKLIGGFLVIAGAGSLIRAALRNAPIAAFDWLRHGMAIVMGVLLLANPHVLAKGIGLFFGLLLLIEGIRNLKNGGVRLLPVLTTAAGVLLVIFPRLLTQTLFWIGGIVLIVIGAVNILGKVNQMKRLEKYSDPNIIDADM